MQLYNRLITIETSYYIIYFIYIIKLLLQIIYEVSSAYYCKAKGESVNGIKFFYSVIIPELIVKKKILANIKQVTATDDVFFFFII